MTTTTADAKFISQEITLKQLRVELRIAQTNTHPDCPDFNYWLWYQDTIRQAIEFKRSIQPKPVVKRGHIDVDAVKARADIVAVIEGYGVQLKKAGRNFRALCPFHNEKTPSFIVYPSEGRYHCFGCQADGDAITFVMKLESVDFRTAAGKVGG